MMIDGHGPGGLPIGRHAQQAPEVDGLTRLRTKVGSGVATGDIIDAVVTAAGVYDLVARPVDRREIG